MSDLQRLVHAFTHATGCDAVVWTRDGETGPLKVEAGHAAKAPPAVVELLPPGGAPAKVEIGDDVVYVAAVAGPKRAWVGVGPCQNATVDASRFVEFLAQLVANLHRARLEVEHAAFELAERYEEINLLYTTSEIFGRTVPSRKPPPASSKKSPTRLARDAVRCWSTTGSPTRCRS